MVFMVVKCRFEHKILDAHTSVFLSYSHKDLRYANPLLAHLASCQQRVGFVVWDASQILPGDLWQTEVSHALLTTHVAMLLISADFLASSFSTKELPLLLHRAQSDGACILPVIVRPCLFEESLLNDFRPVNDQPLSLLSTNAREQFWVALIRSLIYPVREKSVL